MSDVEKSNVQLTIERIINRSRHHEEMFLTDSKTAALDILQYLQNENIISLDANANRYAN